MKKILLIGEFYSSNLGDGILCDCITEIIKTEIKDIQIVNFDISGRNGFSDKEIKMSKLKKMKRKIDYIISISNILSHFEYIRIKSKYKKNEEKIKQICQDNYDLVVFAGGQMFMSTFALVIYYFVKYFKEKNIPIIFNACGVGRFRSKILQNKLKKALNSDNVKFISSRDDVETINNKFLKNNIKKAVKTYDLALWCKNVYQIKRNEQSITVGLGVMYVKKYPERLILKFWKDVIEELNKRKIKWQIFCNGNERDYEFCKKLVTYMNIEEDKIEKRPKRPKELVQIVSKYKAIISFRLHSLIVATSVGIPSIGIIWDDKVKFFFRNINCPERCINIEEKGSKIVDKLLKIYNNNLFNIIEEEKEFSKNLIVSELQKELNRKFEE